MPFDANLVLVDGTTNWTSANLTSYGTPTSTTVTGSFVVVDLLALSSTAAQGMAAIFIADQAGLAVTDALTLTIEGSEAVDFDGDTSHIFNTLATFEVAGATAGVIVGNECPCTIIRRFATTRRYIRAHASLASAGQNFYTCYVLLAPWPFHVL